MDSANFTQTSSALAQPMLDSWNEQAKQYLAFGLGIDHLFMPAYSITPGMAALLAASRHTGWLKPPGALAGWGVLVAALFDAVENFVLWKILPGGTVLQWARLAVVCASSKFGLLIVGLLNIVVASFLPVQRGASAKG